MKWKWGYSSRWSYLKHISGLFVLNACMCGMIWVCDAIFPTWISDLQWLFDEVALSPHKTMLKLWNSDIIFEIYAHWKQETICFIFSTEIYMYICNILSINLIRKFLETNGFCTKIGKIKFWLIFLSFL